MYEEIQLELSLPSPFVMLETAGIMKLQEPAEFLAIHSKLGNYGCFIHQNGSEYSQNTDELSE